METGFDAFRRDGFVPDATVATIPTALDGREQTVRRRSGNLTTLVAGALKRETGADIGVLNGGTIRIDDMLQPGPVRQYDVIRIVPFGGKVLKVTMDGALLARVLDAGEQNVSIGGYLHLDGAARQESGPEMTTGVATFPESIPGIVWVVNGKPLDPAARYSIGVPEFLMTGGESRMGFLTRTNPQVFNVQEFRDIRLVIMDELRLLR
jgi:5'-nucleotidase/UDP-sugar diphosphatase